MSGTLASPVIATAFSAGTNNFNILRLFAALLVLWSHSYPSTGAAYEPFARLTNDLDTAGRFGVMIFFVISGFLVTKSVFERSAADYVRSRVARILPLLTVVIIVQTVAIGIWVSDLPLNQYFAHDLTRAHLWNIAVLRGITYRLPGVFDALPDTTVNGSLWTLPIEIGFYILLPLLAVAGALGPRVGLMLWMCVVSAYAVAMSIYGLGWTRQGPQVWTAAQAFPVLRLGAAFLGGAVLWLWRGHIPLNGGLALAAALALIMSIGTPGAHVIYVLVMPYLVLYAALARPVASSVMHRLGDLSYGTYLLAFPVQQTLVWKLGPGVGATRLSLLATPIVLALAFGCWHLIEAPCLAWRRSRSAAPHDHTSPTGHVFAAAS